MGSTPSQPKLWKKILNKLNAHNSTYCKPLYVNRTCPIIIQAGTLVSLTFMRFILWSAQSNKDNPLSAQHVYNRVQPFYYHFEMHLIFLKWKVLQNGKFWKWLASYLRNKFTHFKLWIASARHNLRWVKIPAKILRLIQQELWFQLTILWLRTLLWTSWEPGANIPKIKQILLNLL